MSYQRLEEEIDELKLNTDTFLDGVSVQKKAAFYLSRKLKRNIMYLRREEEFPFNV